MDNETFMTPEGHEIVAKETGRRKFEPLLSDFVFALAAFVLGYLFSRWVLFYWRGWGVAVFTTAYLLCVSSYLIKKKYALGKNPAAWFWAAVTWLVGFSCALWDGVGLSPVRELFLFCSAVYFIVVASGRAVMGKTGNFLLIDGLNCVLFIPFRNLINQYISFSVLRHGESGSTKKRMPIFLGILLAVLMIVWLIPLLIQADSGGFRRIVESITGILSINRFAVTETLIYCVFAIPIAAYMFGLVSGAAHGKGTETITPENAKKCVAALKIAQPVTVYIALGAVCLLYAVFILCQIPYFFSAFTGNRPEGWLIYSEYARQGFFELCRIAIINLTILALGNVTCIKPRIESRPLKAFNIALALITLLLIATAFSKMALYIGAYGLSILRLLPCVFMLFLATVFIAVIVLQKHSFSIVRFALITGAVMLSVLCLSNPDAIVVRYNTDRYLAGTLSDYDTDILYRAGAAGILPAAAVYEHTENEQLKTSLMRYLTAQNAMLYGSAGEHATSYERYIARLKLEGINFTAE